LPQDVPICPRDKPSTVQLDVGLRIKSVRKIQSSTHVFADKTPSSFSSPRTRTPFQQQQTPKHYDSFLSLSIHWLRVRSIRVCNLDCPCRTAPSRADRLGSAWRFSRSRKPSLRRKAPRYHRLDMPVSFQRLLVQDIFQCRLDRPRRATPTPTRIGASKKAKGSLMSRFWEA
jgi:hypothetical protein